MKPRCGATKRDGTPCTLPVNGFNGLCWAHSPAHAERRRKAASRGGKGKPGKGIKNLHELLEDLTRRVIEGELETGRGAVASQLVNTRIRLLEYERRAKETEELASRIERLEEARRWGT